jgi:hypothetical protein
MHLHKNHKEKQRELKHNTERNTHTKGKKTKMSSYQNNFKIRRQKPSRRKKQTNAKQRKCKLKYPPTRTTLNKIKWNKKKMQ